MDNKSFSMSYPRFLDISTEKDSFYLPYQFNPVFLEARFVGGDIEKVFVESQINLAVHQQSAYIVA